VEGKTKGKRMELFKRKQRGQLRGRGYVSGKRRRCPKNGNKKEKVVGGKTEKQGYRLLRGDARFFWGGSTHIKKKKKAKTLRRGRKRLKKNRDRSLRG